jgi:hypothetical protein
MEIKKFKQKSIQKSDYGVVGIVVALLLVGLFLSVLMIVQTTFIPNWMEQREAEHMEEVSNQFAKLKYAIDTQSLIGNFLNDSVQAMSTSITLGSKEYPILNSARSFGNLEVISDDLAINITNNTGSVNYTFGSIKFSSENAYFLDQNFIYQAGAIIMEQELGDVVSIDPSFKPIAEEKNLIFHLPSLKVLSGKPSVSGYGTYPVRTEFINFTHYTITDINKITIFTDYPNAWSVYLNKTLANGGFSNSNHYDILSNENNVIIDFSKTQGLEFNIDLKISNIDVQLAPGWTEYS